MVNRRSKTNTMYFKDIPEPEVDPVEKIIKLLQNKYNLKRKRAILVQDARDLRQKIYNLSMEINKIETQADNLVMRKIIKTEVIMDGVEKR